MNNHFKHVLCVAALAASLSFPSLASADVTPDVLAKQTTNEVLEIVRQDKDIKRGNSRKILDLVEKKILPVFDFERMTRLAVGKHWPKASPEQRVALVDAFRGLLVRTYSSALSGVADYTIVFKPYNAAPGAAEATVSTEVIKPGAPPISIDYRVARVDSGWKVVDVKVEGASLVSVYRNSFNSEVRRGGIDGLVESLKKRVRDTGAPE